MAEERESMDLRTLEQVRQLLESSEFATADDLLAHGGGLPAEMTPRPRPVEHLESRSSAPLPRRR